MQLGRFVRTARHIRPRQALAQAARLWRGAPRPASAGQSEEASLRVAAAATDFLPAPRHARWDGGRRVELIGRAVAFRDAIDWDHAGEGPLFAYHLHQFDYARHRALSPEARSALLLDWVERHRRGVGWNPHPTSLRILSWGKLLATPGALVAQEPIRRRLLASLADQVETLWRHPETRLQANHLFSNYLGVVFGGLLLRHPRSEAWLATAGALQRELAAQFPGDGLHEERSPMYHALLLENVLDLLNLGRAAAAAPAAPAVTASLTESLAEAASRMLAALEVLTHPDGEIALFADSAFGIAHPLAALAGYAARLGIAVRGPCRPGVLEGGGYARIEAGPLVALASLAGPAPPHQPGHAHCDVLAFELSLGRERVVTDSGVPEYIPGALREACRSVRSHATVEVDGREQAEIWGAHRVGGRPVVAFRVSEPLRSLAGECRSWSTPETVHRRSFRAEDGGLVVEDAISGRARPVAARLPLHPGVVPQLADGTRPRLDLRLASGRRLRVRLPDGLAYRIESLPYFPEFGRRVDRRCLVGRADAWPGGLWRFEPEGGPPRSGRR